MKYLHLLLGLALLWSCTENAPVVETPTKLTLHVDKTEMFINFDDSITMTVTDEHGQDWTDEAKYMVDGKDYAGGHIFKTDEVCSANLTAELDEYKLKTNKIAVRASIGAKLTVVLSKQEAVNDGIDKVKIRVFDEKRNEVTEEAELYAGDIKLTDVYYSTKTAGKVIIKAIHGELEATAEVNFKADAKVTKRLLMEDYTGTWCPNCPLAPQKINDAEAKGIQIVTVAIHRHKGDPMENRFSIALADKFNKEEYYPRLNIDRKEEWEHPFTSDISQLGKEEAALGILIESKLNGNKAEVTTTVRLVKEKTGLKLTVYLLEDGLNYRQEGVKDPESYIHNHVLRQSLTDVFGDEIPAAEISTSKNYTKTFSFDIDPAFKAENCRIVAFVSEPDASSNSKTKVLNAQEIELGMDSEY